jgi:hypothetical protein
MHKILFVTVFLLYNLFALQAQNLSNSPYGRYGIGDISFSPHPHMNGLGMPAVAWADSHVVNPTNPAALLAQRFTVLEMGLSTALNYYQTSVGNTNSRNAGFGYFALAFGVIPKKWSIAFGLKPISLLGYELNTNTKVNNDIGNVNFRYTGQGGFNNLHLSNGFAITKNLSFGTNLNYNFGVNDFQSLVLISDSLNGLNSRVSNQYSISDFTFDFGLRYQLLFKRGAKTKKERSYIAKDDSLFSINKVYPYSETSTDSFYVIKKVKVKRQDSLHLSFGLVYTPSIRANANRTFLADRFLGQPPVENVIDTILYIDKESGRIVLPQVIKAGIVLRNSSDKFALALNGSYYDWSTYRSFDNIDSLKNNLQLNVGLQIVPNQYSTKNYFSRVRYRMGFTYSDGYLRINNTDIKEYMVSAGFGFPFRRQKNSTATKTPISLLNIGIQAGYRGNVTNNLIRENFVRFTIGLSMTDDWFNKRKYD